MKVVAPFIFAAVATGLILIPAASSLSAFERLPEDAMATTIATFERLGNPT